MSLEDRQGTDQDRLQNPFDLSYEDDYRTQNKIEVVADEKEPNEVEKDSIMSESILSSDSSMKGKLASLTIDVSKLEDDSQSKKERLKSRFNEHRKVGMKLRRMLTVDHSKRTMSKFNEDN